MTKALPGRLWLGDGESPARPCGVARTVRAKPLMIANALDWLTIPNSVRLQPNWILLAESRCINRPHAAPAIERTLAVSNIDRSRDIASWLKCGGRNRGGYALLAIGRAKRLKLVSVEPSAR